MQKILILLLTLTFLACESESSLSSQENWDNYRATYEGGKSGSTTLRMDLIDKAPIKKYPYVLITGLTYESNRADGFPEAATFDVLHEVASKLENFLDKQVENIHVGSFMYDFKRLEYFYIANEEGIEQLLADFYTSIYPDEVYYFNVKQDENWTTYREFLYPSEAILTKE